MGRIILIAAVVLLGFIAFVSSIDVMQSRTIQYHFTVEFTQRVVGGLMALIGAIGILWDWREEGPLSRFGSSVVVLLSGILLSSSSWGAGLALAAIVVASRFSFSEDSREHGPRPKSQGSSSVEEDPPKWLDR